jgi:hypothetical protein
VRGSRLSAVVLLSLCAASAGGLASGCGEAHQDAHEPRGSFSVAVVHASFPTVQAVSRPARLALTVRNTSARTLPDVAVAVNSFSYISAYPNLASRQRPVWIVDQGPGAIPARPVETIQVNQPGSGTTATANIWALGSLAPGASRSFVWRVTPIKPGLHRVSYLVYAGLNGKSRALLAGGHVVVGSFNVAIASRPPRTHVDPQTGKVVPGPYIPSAPYAR